jgi:prepilin-type N-terminal cleavage/methylation domain-containing protein
MKAFSLIELMVVIAIVSVLSAVAVVGYRYYSYRSNAVEALSIMQPYVNQINVWYNTRNTVQTWGVTNTNVSIPVDSNCCSAVNYWMSGIANVNFIKFWVTWKTDKMPDSGDRRLYLMAWADPSNPSILKWQCAYDTRGSGRTIDINAIPRSCLNAYSGSLTSF